MRFTAKYALVRALSATLVLSLAACGGGGGATNALPGGSAPLAAGKAVVKIALTVPSATMQVHRRSPKYIAPTTKGFGFDFATSSSALNPAQPTVAVNFSNQAAPTIAVDTYGGSMVACSSNPDGSELCNFSLTVPASSTPYDLQISTFDSAPSTTSTTTFNPIDLLSQQTITSVSVSPGTPTLPILLSLDGVPASTELVPMPNQVHLQPNGGGYTLIGMTPVMAHIYALDRDGNIIVGDGAPQVCVQSPIDATTSAPYVAVSVSSPGTGPSGQTCDNAPTTAPIWTLQTKSWSASPLSLTLNAVASGPSPTGGTGAAATSSVSLSEEQELWVSAPPLSGGQAIQGYAFTTGVLPRVITSDFGLVPSADATAYGYGGLAADAFGNLWFAPNVPALIGTGSTDYLCVSQPQAGTLAIPQASCSTESYAGGGSFGISIATTTIGGQPFGFILDGASSSTQEVTAYPLTLPSPATATSTQQSFNPASFVPSGDFSTMTSIATAPLTLAPPAGGTIWVDGYPTSGAHLYLAGFSLSPSAPPGLATGGVTSAAPEVSGDSFIGPSDYMSIDDSGHIFVAESEGNLTSGNGQEDIFEFQIQSGTPLSVTATGGGYIPASAPSGGTQHSMAVTYQGTILESYQTGSTRGFYELSEPSPGPITPIQSIFNDPVLGSASGLAITP
ncbi:MAG: hypothetical protein ACP5O6_10015 [Candidatus Baltobacteraceae bacterium]